MADKSLNRTELVAAIAAESGQSQAAVNGVLDSLFHTLAKS
ncbi:MAG TPA: integration host factor, partial [Terrimesophilobacter sp.]